jgi:branched-chain amino acid transport system permease protein
MDVFLVTLLNGISLGGVLFLVASGLSLVLGVMGIANLAHGALYMIGAYLGWTMVAQHGGNFLLAAVAAAATAGVVGLVIERGFLRRLHGLFNEQVLLSLGFVYIITNLCLWIWGSIPKSPFTAPFLSGSFFVAGWPYPVSRVVIILVGLALAVGLWWLQDKTRVGAIVRAGMDNKEVTEGLGINLKLALTALFVVGASIAGFAGVIGGQMLGASLDYGIQILVLALIVVVVGGVGSVQGALLGAVIIGLVDAFGKLLFPELAMFTLYLVMIIILLVRPAGLLGRPLETKAISQPLVSIQWKGTLSRYIPYVVVGVILILVPAFMATYLQSIMTKLLILGLLAISLNLIFGYTGLFSLGHAAFFGVAGYTVGIAMVRFGVESFWISGLLAILMAAFVAAVFGFIALRVSGLFFLLVTFALGQLLWSIAVTWYPVTMGPTGLIGIPRPDLGLPWLNLLDPLSFYYFVFAVFAICYFLLHRLINSPFGYALQGIRDSEPRMRALGYNTWLYKYIAFIIAGLFAGVAGLLFAYFNGIIAPSHLDLSTSSLAMLMVILGGAGTLWGPVIGAGVIVFVEYFASLLVPERWPLILGIVFILAVMYLRGGISLHLVRSYGKMLLRWNR